MGNVARTMVFLMTVCLAVTLAGCASQPSSGEASSSDTQESEQVSETTKVIAHGYSYEIMRDWESDLSDASAAKFYPQGKANADKACLQIIEYIPNKTLTTKEEQLAYITPTSTGEQESSPAVSYGNITPLGDGKATGIMATVTITTDQLVQKGKILRFFVEDNRYVEASYLVPLDQFESNQSAIERMLASFEIES